MSFELNVVLDEKTSNTRRKEYLVKNGEKLMYLFRIITPPRGMEDLSPSYKFEPVLSIGLVPDISRVNNELYIFYEENKLASMIRDENIDQFIEDTAFAKESVKYIVDNVL